MTKMPTWFAISTKTEEEEAAVVEGELEPSVEDMLQLKWTTRMMAWSKITTRKVAAAAGVVVVLEEDFMVAALISLRIHPNNPVPTLPNWQIVRF